MKRSAVIFMVVIVVVGINRYFLPDALAKPKGKQADICLVVAYAGGVYRKDLAQYKEIKSTPGVSQECLDFAKGSTIDAVCNFEGKGSVQIVQIRRIYPGTQELVEHCHYGCLGNADDSCESQCKGKVAQIGTDIGSMPCPQGDI